MGYNFSWNIRNKGDFATLSWSKSGDWRPLNWGVFCLCWLRIWSSNNRTSSNNTVYLQTLNISILFFTTASQFFHCVIYQAVLSVHDQLNMFRDYIGKLKADVGEERTAFILAKSIFFISMGSNDILVTYFMSPFRRNEYNVEEYTSMLVDVSSNFLQVCFWCE